MKASEALKIAVDISNEKHYNHIIKFVEINAKLAATFWKTNKKLSLDVKARLEDLGYTISEREVLQNNTASPCPYATETTIDWSNPTNK